MGVYAPAVMGVYTCSTSKSVSNWPYTTHLAHAQERASVREELYINKESTLSGEGNASVCCHVSSYPIEVKYPVLASQALHTR